MAHMLQGLPFIDSSFGYGLDSEEDFSNVAFHHLEASGSVVLSMGRIAIYNSRKLCEFHDKELESGGNVVDHIIGIGSLRCMLVAVLDRP